MAEYFLVIQDKTPTENLLSDFGLKSAKQNDKLILQVVKREKGKVCLNLVPYGGNKSKTSKKTK